MLPTFIILFREVLEISIILSIILAATRGVAGRGRWVWAGIAGGVAGSALIAVFADVIADALEGSGQEAFNAGILLVAVAMITWTVVWMKSHARELSARIKKVGQGVSDGSLPLYSIAVVVSLTMWREGAEIVLFMTGVLSTSEDPLIEIIAGGLAGALVAGGIGVALYFGLIRLSMKHLFSVSGWLLVLVACGMSAQAANFLVQAGWLPEIASAVWDTSNILSEESVLGRILSAMIGYSAQPSAMQLIWYAATFVLIVGLMRVAAKKPVAVPVTAAALLAAFAVAYAPYVIA